MCSRTAKRCFVKSLGDALEEGTIARRSRSTPGIEIKRGCAGPVMHIVLFEVLVVVEILATG